MKMQKIDNKENSEGKEERGGKIDMYIGKRDFFGIIWKTSWG